MIRRPPRSTLTCTPVPCATLFRSLHAPRRLLAGDELVRRTRHLRAVVELRARAAAAVRRRLRRAVVQFDGADPGAAECAAGNAWPGDRRLQHEIGRAHV